jgi:metallophosphoesterase (TIGR00282 family)
MHILFIGDVVGNAGCTFLEKKLPQLKRKYQIDLTVVNGENSAQGNGITKYSMEQLFSAGADIITTGNHCFQRREALSIYEKETVLRPVNFPDSCPGHGVTIWDNGPFQVAVINLMGTAYMDPLDNPFTVIEQLLPTLPTKNILVDFHAEATAEKKAMGYFLAGKVSAVLGTHTHVQTADETILQQHTGYLTDVGMTGAEESILGVTIKPALDRFRFRFAQRFTEAQDPCFGNAVHLELDTSCVKCMKIERIIFR